MTKESTPRQILNELLELAVDKQLFDFVRGDMPSSALDPRRLKFNAERVGKLVESLTDEQREVLKSLKWNDVKNGIRAPRPEKPVTRLRGPVKLSK